MGTPRFSDEFKKDAVHQVVDRGYPVTEVSARRNGHRVLRQRCNLKYAFVAKHRPSFSVRAMCRCLRVHPSGFYAWLKDPLSKRALEDRRQTGLIEEAWKAS